MTFDVIVLGAGMVGTSAALQLAERGRRVGLVDRRGIGEETSFGNAGVVEREGLVPVGIPRDLVRLFRYAFNLAPEANYHPSFLPKVAPWLLKLFQATDRVGIETYARAIDTLGRFAIAEHRRLAEASGVSALFRETGWVRVYRTARGLARDADLHALAERFGIVHHVLGRDALHDLEPDLKPIAHAGVFWPETQTVAWPESVTKAYGERFAALGGAFAIGEARSLRRVEESWVVSTEAGEWRAAKVVVALGPWSRDLLDRFGLRFPFAVKRGYHMHFAAERGARLSRPIVDVEIGCCLTPMERGLRLTTGVEFAERDARPTPRQLDQLKPLVRQLFPLGAELDPEPWLGRRPALPDGLPIIGPAPGVPEMWLDFGHGHLGFTQGPISGRLIAEAITGEPTLVDLTPFRAERFGGGR
jgi:D-amino-acid dehydrogenase